MGSDYTLPPYMANADGRSLGDVVRCRRIEINISLRDLAKKLAIAASYLSDIENNRRVPSEDVLERLSTELKLKLDDLLARAGRFGEEAERYMKQHPAAGVLFRRISDKRLQDDDLKKLLSTVEKMGKKDEP
jgi:transcriptional regulator with XRE-family HTH domain